jgi:eukaryotic-like serine/threonine-protein kinase
MAILSSRRPQSQERPVRLSLLPPDGVTLSSPEGREPRGLAISPDGQAIAFSGRNASGQTQVWIRSLDAADARPLLGTDGGVDPFWSPDGRAIGFFADGKLKKIILGGGPPDVLCDAVNPRGGAWSPEGFIVFSLNAGFDGIWRLSVASAERTALTIPKKGAHRWPHFLPDGRHFVYFEGSPDGTAFISVASVASNETKRILASTTEAAYAPPGHLVFARETTLLAQRFNKDTLQVSGEPVVVAEHLTSAGVVGLGNFSVSGTALAFLSLPANESRPAWLDREGHEIESITKASSWRSAMGDDPELSPDETRLAITRTDPQTRAPQLWIADLTRGTTTPLTSYVSYGGIWSPDGKRLAFTSNRNGAPDLYVRESSGASGDELLVKSSLRKTPTDWSRDGQFIVYTNQDTRTKADIWVLPLEGDRHPVSYLATEFNEGAGRLSPDGRWMAYVSDESGEDEVYVRSFPMPAGRIRVSTHGGSRPQWGHDGKKLFYVAPDQKLMVTELGASPTEPGVPRPLLQLHIAGWTSKNDYAYTGNNYAVSKDEQRIFVNVTREDRPSPITVVLHWQEELKRLIPSK